ncbi:hypothetical protein [Egicoccus sp. AB-alg2]|uniref:hypothetical protein n=1 Tax=Egicoccus sp. AB-alg2 TaxID=3242693 RepID=UPI00359DB011
MLGIAARFGMGAATVLTMSLLPVAPAGADTYSAVIQGVVFSDDNGNGVRDNSEMRLPVVPGQVLLEGGFYGGQFSVGIWDDPYGDHNGGWDAEFIFDELPAGTYQVEFEPYYECQFTTPNPVEVRVERGRTHTLNFGVRCATGVIEGAVFEDDNKDGLFGNREYELSTPVRVFRDGVQVASRRGRFLVEELMPGTYTVRADVPAGYVATTTTSRTVTIRTGDRIERLRFGFQRTPSVSVAASPTKLVHGNSTTVTGRILRGSTALSGKAVRLQVRHTTQDPWRDVAQVTSDRDGRFSFAVKPSRNLQYRWSFVGDTTTVPGSSSLVSVTVEQRVTATLSTTSMSVGRTATLDGKVSPAHAGQPVVLQQNVNGIWRKVAETKLSSTSTYRFRLSPTRAGTYTYRVVRPADADHALGTSPTRKLTVR